MNTPARHVRTRAACLSKVIAFAIALAAAAGFLSKTQAETPPQPSDPAADLSLPEDLPFELPPDIPDLLAGMPVQEGGRIKPLSTFARFALLRLNARTTLSVSESDGSKTRLDAMSWLCECLFYPRRAVTRPCFNIDTDEIITALGLRAHEKKRDRYAYAELAPGRDQLVLLARAMGRKESRELNWLERQVVRLAENMLFFESLIHYGDFARNRLDLRGISLFEDKFDRPESVPLSRFLETAPAILRALGENTGDAAQNSDQVRQGIDLLFERLNQAYGALPTAPTLAVIPSADPKNDAWKHPLSLIETALRPDMSESARSTVASVQLWEALYAAESPKDFRQAVIDLVSYTADRAEPAGQNAKVALELRYYRMNLLLWAQWLFVLAFVAGAPLWSFTRGKAGYWAAMALQIPPTLLLAAAITLRCIIRGRPPVTTLYETILFTTLTAVLIAWTIEVIQRGWIIGVLAALLGGAGLFLAGRYEAAEGMDTMPAVIAVLDTNFWLATHVTTITIGYGAGLLAAALAHAHMLGVLLFPSRREKFAGLQRAIYGVVCFCLVFSLAGTVLGGVWASRSWGRFWGWDPKENGALMIVLWCLILLHARRDGFLAGWGMSLGSVVLGMVVAFSWWGVNALGVGLHSYGFTSGIWLNLALFWAIELVVLAAGLGASVSMERRERLQRIQSGNP
ncbi:MAG TPA: cytochrome c biogenesis protein CcsA [Candidatus Hydrogenedentes bacterium]|nr:cytochrome c biogenesis protein CcsA [Candidatus Hydrogenedentota bacterium]